MATTTNTQTPHRAFLPLAPGSDPLKGMPLLSVIASDEAELDELFSRHRCRHLYFDIGTNIGVQIRKLFQPALYPGAKVLPTFDHLFGPAPRCHVCAIGFEPNPHHNHTLAVLEESLRSAGAPVHIFRAAASDADSVTTFMLPANIIKSKDEDWTATMMAPRKSMRYVHGAPYLNLRGEVAVRTIDLSRIIHYAAVRLKEQHPMGRIFAKIDMEGAEVRTLPYLILQQSLCLLDYATIEWHNALFRSNFFRESARARGMLDHEAGAQAAQLIANRTQEAIEAAVASPDCKLQTLHAEPEQEDETFMHDHKPLPSQGTGVCSHP